MYQPWTEAQILHSVIFSVLLNQNGGFIQVVCRLLLLLMLHTEPKIRPLTGGGTLQANQSPYSGTNNKTSKGTATERCTLRLTRPGLDGWMVSFGFGKTVNRLSFRFGAKNVCISSRQFKNTFLNGTAKNDYYSLKVSLCWAGSWQIEIFCFVETNLHSASQNGPNKVQDEFEIQITVNFD